MDTALDLAFGDGRYIFWLGMPQITALESGKKSLMQMHAEMGEALGRAHVDDAPVFLGGGPARFGEVAEVIKHGLLGGRKGEVQGVAIEVSALDVTRIMDTYVHGRPLAETLPVAWAILQTVIMGVDLKKKVTPAPRTPSRRSRSAKAT